VGGVVFIGRGGGCAVRHTESILIKHHIRHLCQNLLLQFHLVPYRFQIIEILHEIPVEICNLSH